MNILSQAIALAAQAHEDQVDKGGKPYILHPLEVSRKVRLLGFGEIEQSAAVLHDVIEDCKLKYAKRIADLSALSSSRLLWLCNMLTKRDGQSYDEFIDSIIATNDAGLISIKMCDIDDNSQIHRLKGVTEKDFERMKKYHRAYLKLKNALEKLNGRVHQGS